MHAAAPQDATASHLSAQAVLNLHEDVMQAKHRLSRCVSISTLGLSIRTLELTGRLRLGSDWFISVRWPLRLYSVGPGWR